MSRLRRKPVAVHWITVVFRTVGGATSAICKAAQTMSGTKSGPYALDAVFTGKTGELGTVPDIVGQEI